MGGKLFLTAGLVTVIGLVILSFASNNLHPPLTQLGDVSADMLETNVRVRGQSCGIHEFEGGSILLKICDGEDMMEVYLPYNIASQINQTEFSNILVEATGTVQVYKGRLELVVQRPENLVVVE